MPRRRLDVVKAKQDVCTALSAHNTVKASCGYAGIAEPTFYRWLAMDRDFREAVRSKEADSEVRLVSLIVKAAQEGTWTAAAWLLERHPRTRKDWRKTQEVDFRQLSTAQLLDLLQASEQPIESAGDALAAGDGEEET
jgi:hypothetical protein